MSEKQTDMSEKKSQQAEFLLEKKQKGQQASETVPAESLLEAENNNKDTGTEQKKEEKRVGLGWGDRVDFRKGDAEGKIAWGSVILSANDNSISAVEASVGIVLLCLWFSGTKNQLASVNTST